MSRRIEEVVYTAQNTENIHGMTPATD